MIGTMLVAKGLWNKPGVFTTDEFDPDPYMDALISTVSHGLSMKILF